MARLMLRGLDRGVVRSSAMKHRSFTGINGSGYRTKQYYPDWLAAQLGLKALQTAPKIEAVMQWELPSDVSYSGGWGSQEAVGIVLVCSNSRKGSDNRARKRARKKGEIGQLSSSEGVVIRRGK